MKEAGIKFASRPAPCMGSHLHQFLNAFPLPISQNLISPNQLTPFFFINNSRFMCHVTAIPNKRSRFTHSYLSDDNDEFDFKNVRKWWSDDEDDDEDEIENDGFGFFQGVIALNWVSKVFEAFGWMIPAVIISIVLGNGPDTIIMTLALPLAQSLFSLASDTFFGRPVENGRRRKSKSKKGPFARAGNSRVRKRKRKVVQTGAESGEYKSWVSTENVSGKSERRRDFGGWDELINEVKVDDETKYVNEEIMEEMIEISRRMKEDAPEP